MNASDFIRAATLAGASPELAKLLLDQFAIAGHSHGPAQVFVDAGGTLNLDEWSDNIEERLADVEGDEGDEDEGDEDETDKG